VNWCNAVCNKNTSCFSFAWQTILWISCICCRLGESNSSTGRWWNFSSITVTKQIQLILLHAWYSRWGYYIVTFSFALSSVTATCFTVLVGKLQYFSSEWLPLKLQFKFSISFCLLTAQFQFWQWNEWLSTSLNVKLFKGTKKLPTMSCC